MGNIERIKLVSKIIMETLESGKKPVVVVSAQAGDTDRLLALCKQASSPAPSQKELAEMDNILATGEQISASLLTLCLLSNGINSRSFSGSEAGILTDENYGNARIQNVVPDKIFSFIEQKGVPIVSGFQGLSEIEQRITTLGRGGSDTSAVALACALKAEKCEIYKDVEGIYTGDPTFIEKPIKLPFLTYSSAMEMTAGGAKVLEPRAAGFAAKYKIKTHILSNFDKNSGSIIEERINEDPIVQNISIEEKFIFVKLHRGKQNVILQNLSNKSVSFNILTIEKTYIYLLVFKSDFYKLEKDVFEEIEEEIYMLSIIGSFFGKPDVIIASNAILENQKCEIILSVAAQSRIIFIIKGKSSSPVLEILHKNLFK